MIFESKNVSDFRNFRSKRGKPNDQRLEKVRTRERNLRKKKIQKKELSQGKRTAASERTATSIFCCCVEGNMIPSFPSA